MVNRRTFIKQCIALYGSLLLIPACKNGTGRLQYRCFSIDEGECLGAICEQFVPTDEYIGAKEAGVVNFIDKLLYQRFPELEQDYKSGIQALENIVWRHSGKLLWICLGKSNMPYYRKWNVMNFPKYIGKIFRRENSLIWFYGIRCKGFMGRLDMEETRIM